MYQWLIKKLDNEWFRLVFGVLISPAVLVMLAFCLIYMYWMDTLYFFGYKPKNKKEEYWEDGIK